VLAAERLLAELALDGGHPEAARALCWLLSLSAPFR